MNPNYPSIFNDVIGPVMRGPSSSHCAASIRIGKLSRDLMNAEITEVLVEFDPHGSLATTHESQGSDMGLFGGLLGWDPDDERLLEAARTVIDAGIEVAFKISEYGAKHPNTYKLTLKSASESHEIVALSTGGGMIEVIEIDGIPLSIVGDYFETLVFIKSDEQEIFRFIKRKISADEINLCFGKGGKLIQIKAQSFPDDKIFNELNSRGEILGIKRLSPVLPILSRKGMEVPFITCEEMLRYGEVKKMELWELALEYESARGNIPKHEVFEKMKRIVRILNRSILRGIEGTSFANRILGYQSGSFKTQMENGRLLDGGLLNQIVLYVTAMMEVKSSMGVILAAPTAGACGVLPGTILGGASALRLSDDEATKGMLAAGMIGVFIAAHSTFAAEVGGCQAECGAGSGMAAAALVTLAGGLTIQAVNAASMALQNVLGMVCDPVANRVEVPCLGRNVLAASNALSCANMALAGFDPVIPLDEVIETMDKVGKSLPPELRCTALGGLSVTRTSKEIEKRLNSLECH
jgi:L-serine dehydratase